ncbi:multiubiquitin domain-containing protein [Bosea sp. (in: a-proteobacteria)]|uniref:multiubiquitin domain-containing protein n=1 Tax=Bosea sp. (in: a-proteobacteria) TaxID=1871050 RepID=UPI00273655A8|nr:multiubiquitin domain-containing protein [Bosea sp. (in: a-proteobacteria)]MDP3411050.1 multiubiquitin domain-containing protein [Bosea sp. (in: a-proteobacteria)]
MEAVLMNTDGNRKQGNGTFEVQIGDKDFDFVTVTFEDAEVTGAQVAMSVGKRPVENYVVLRHLNTGELESLRPTETSELDKNKVSRFFVVEGGDTHRFFVDGLAMEWPRKKPIAWQIKLLAGAGDEQALTLERPGVDLVFDDDEEVDIGGGDAERFKLRKRKKTVTVIYGGDTEFELERRVYTTEELMTEFGVPAGYKLDVIGSDGVFREMAPGERLKVRDGMEFASHPPVGQSS